MILSFRTPILTSSLQTKYITRFMSKFEQIFSSTNSKVKLMRLHSKSKISRNEENSSMFLEGHRSVIDALNLGIQPLSVMVTPQALVAPLGKELNARLMGCRVNVAEVTDKIMKDICDTVTCQGVCALFPRIEKTIPHESDIFVVCDNISDPGTYSMDTMMYILIFTIFLLYPGYAIVPISFKYNRQSRHYHSDLLCIRCGCGVNC